jgi:glycosyltransferase involved in cell wall biosynthesis
VLRPSREAPVVLVSADPVVLHAIDWAFLPGAPAFRMLRALAGRQVDLLVTMSWNHATRQQVDRLRRLDWGVRRGADHRVTFLASSGAELERFERAGLGALLVSNTAFCDERIYRPMPGRRARFDAVYDARLTSFKRHPLAAEVPNLALITSLTLEEGEPGYRASLAPLLARTHIFNGHPFQDGYRFLSPQEVNESLNQCAVGLALSREEGGMYASTQYLLAGLPVVSTSSRGGRDEFYHPDYVRIVDASPRAVADGVAEMRHCKVPPEEIRARTLARLREHRQRLFRCIDGIYASQGCRRSFEAEWPSLFFDKWIPAEKDPTAAILAAIRTAETR